VTGIIDPITGRTSVHEALLAQLMDWTTENAITHAMIHAGFADRRDILHLAVRVGYTVSVRAGEDIKPALFLTEVETAQFVLGFLVHRGIRRVIAKHVATAYGLGIRQALRDLRAMALDLGQSVSETLRERENASPLILPANVREESTVVH
jgi:hypothetical protein